MKKVNQLIIEVLLPTGKLLRKTNRGNAIFISHYKNAKLFFTIPNHKNPDLPFKKAISIKLIIEIFETKNYDYKNFPYSDCRKSAMTSVIEILKTSKQTKAQHKKLLNSK